jgi:hypothetical protein
MIASEVLFLQAIDSYRAWIATGKDFLNHAELYDVWDDAVLAYAQSINLRRAQAVSHVLTALQVLR